MPRLVFFLLTLGLLAAAAQTPTTDSGWEIDPDGLKLSSGERFDSGWEIDPNGSTSYSPEERPESGWAIDPNG